MKNKYEIENLISGNLYSIVPYNRLGELMGTMTEQTFIFERSNLPFMRKAKYVEVFTGISKKKYKDNYENGFHSIDFGAKYIVNDKDIKEYLTEDELRNGYVSNYRLLQIYNHMNFKKVDSEDRDSVKIKM